MSGLAAKSATPPAAGGIAGGTGVGAAGPQWRADQRLAAQAEFERLGLPTRHDEAWKYTNVSGLESFRLSGASGLSVAVEPLSPDAIPIVVANGVPVWETRSLPGGIEIGALAGGGAAETAAAWLGRALPHDGKAMVALNTARFADAVIIRVAAGVNVEQPIELVVVGQGAEAPVEFHSRVLVVLERGASATLVERHQGTGRYFSNTVVEVALGEEASLIHYRLQAEDEAAVHLTTCGIGLAKRASYQSVALECGARLGRHEIYATFDGDHASFRLDGAYLAAGRQHLDTTTFVTHRATHGTSRQVFKGVLHGASRGVVSSTVRVERGAQKTDSHQLSRALLLSPEAEVDGKPELEIYADDVKCGHGASVGAIDEAALFYLCSRGVDEKAARALLIEGFVAEVIDIIPSGAMRDAFTALVAQRLAASQLKEEA